MDKNKISNLIIFAVFVLFFASVSFARAEVTSEVLPDNVKITTNSDGSISTVIVNSKPGYSTNVETSCVNGKCTHSAVSKKINEKDIQDLKDKIKKQQEYWDKFWKQQEEFFKAEQKMFQDIWGSNYF